jgi:hypothetical protein
MGRFVVVLLSLLLVILQLSAGLVVPPLRTGAAAGCRTLPLLPLTLPCFSRKQEQQLALCLYANEHTRSSSSQGVAASPRRVFPLLVNSWLHNKAVLVVPAATKTGSLKSTPLWMMPMEQRRKKIMKVGLATLASLFFVLLTPSPFPFPANAYAGSDERPSALILSAETVQAAAAYQGARKSAIPATPSPASR